MEVYPGRKFVLNGNFVPTEVCVGLKFVLDGVCLGQKSVLDSNLVPMTTLSGRKFVWD